MAQPRDPSPCVLNFLIVMGFRVRVKAGVKVNSLSNLNALAGNPEFSSYRPNPTALGLGLKSILTTNLKVLARNSGLGGFYGFVYCTNPMRPVYWYLF